MGRAWTLLCILLISVGLASCAPLLPDLRFVKFTLPKRQASASCGFVGNSDFYGLGIRIGIYLQWITAFMANHLLPDAIEGNLETNTIFLLALFIATAVTTTNNTVQSSELIVLLHLSFGFLFSVLSIWGHRTARTGPDKDTKTRFPLIGSFFRLTLATALSAYGAWFWFRGRSLHHHSSASCDDFTFLFAKFDVAGNVRVFFEIQSSIILFFYAILFARELLMIVCFFVFLTIKTAVIAGFAVWFQSGGWLGPFHGKEQEQREAAVSSESESHASSQYVPPKHRVEKAGYLFKQWVGLSFAMGWKQANGKESAGENRPHLADYLILFLDVWIFICRTSIQFFCLFLFKKSPSMDFIPMIQLPIVTRTMPRGIWWKTKKMIRVIYEYVG